MFPLRLVKLRDIVLARPFIDEAKLVEAGELQVAEEQARNTIFLQSVRKKAKETKRRVVEENVRETRKVEEAARQRQDKVLEMQNELRLVTEKQALKAVATTRKSKHGTIFNKTQAAGTARCAPTSKTPLAHARMVTSKSSKLNYLLKEARPSVSSVLFAICSSSPTLGFGTFQDGEILDLFQHAFDPSSRRRCADAHGRHVPSIHDRLAGAHPPTICDDVRNVRQIQGLPHGIETWFSRIVSTSLSHIIGAPLRILELSCCSRRLEI
jgi:hypothetical protein